MARLPIPGSDDGSWGDVLNGFLEVSLASDGTLNPGVIGTAQLEANSVTNAQLDSPTQTTLASVAAKYTLPSGGIPGTDMAIAVQTNLTKASTALQSSSTVTGDLSGTVSSPTVAKIKGTTISSPSGGATSYLNATGTWTTPSGSGSSSNASSVDGVTVTGTPSANQVLIASGSTAASWQSLPTIYQVQNDTTNQVPLGANATYTGPVLNPTTSGFDVVVRATSDQQGTLIVQDSPDGTTWRTIASQATTSAGSLQSAFFSALTLKLYARIIYVNGGTAQTTFEVVRQLIF